MITNSTAFHVAKWAGCRDGSKLQRWEFLIRWMGQGRSKGNLQPKGWWDSIMRMNQTGRKSCVKTQRGEEFSEFEELMGLIGLESNGNNRERHEVRLWGAQGSHHDGPSRLLEDFGSNWNAMGSQADLKQERMWQDSYFRIILWLLHGAQTVLAVLSLPELAPRATAAGCKCPRTCETLDFY